MGICNDLICDICRNNESKSEENSWCARCLSFDRFEPNTDLLDEALATANQKEKMLLDRKHDTRQENYALHHKLKASEGLLEKLKIRAEKAEEDLLKAKGHFSYCCKPQLSDLEKLDKDNDMVCCRCGAKGDFPFHPSDDGFGTDGQYCPNCGHSGLDIIPVWECIDCRKEKLKIAGAASDD